MNKSFRKLIIVTMALVVSLGVAIGTTFAWFSMNNTVTITGMEVKTKVSSNLFIADNNTAGLAGTAKLSEANFGTSVSITPGTPTLLEPVSTTDGKHFYYTVDAKANGAKEHTDEDYTQYNYTDTTTPSEVASASDLTAFNGSYDSTGAEGYKDFVYQLKAINTADSAKNITITQLDLVYTDPVAASAVKAYRVAVFVQKIKANNTFDGNSGTLVGIYAPAGAANHNGKAVNASGALADITYNTATTLTSVTAQSSEYFKVVLRIYLEGEDTTCTNDTFLNLDASWSLTAKFEFDTKTAAVTNLGPLYLLDETIATAATSIGDPAVDYYKVGDTVYYMNTATYSEGTTKFYTISGSVATEVEGIVVYTAPISVTGAVSDTATVIEGVNYYQIGATEYYIDTATYDASASHFYTVSGGVATMVTRKVVYSAS